MPDLNTNLYALGALRGVQGADRLIGGSLKKLSSGLAINSGADNPAGLVISETLRSQISGINAAMRNSQEALNVVNIAEAGAGQASDLLVRARELAVRAANTGANSPGQVAALQTELDNTLEAINRLAGSTRFAGQALLDGSTPTRTFQLGADGAAATEATVDMPDIRTTTLGTSGGGAALETVRAGGANDLAADPNAAIQVIDQAIADVNAGRGTLGAFQKDTLQSVYNTLSVAFENVTATESSIRDLNFAEGVSDQILGANLLQAGIFGMKNANFAKQAMLQLLG